MPYAKLTQGVAIHGRILSFVTNFQSHGCLGIGEIEGAMGNRGAMGTQESRTQEAAEVGNRFGGGMIRSDLLKEQN